jgi:Flp pilus assembly protein TadD/serine/threonine protein kinase
LSTAGRFQGVAASVDSDESKISGLWPVQRIAQSYLGSLWIALDKRTVAEGTLALWRQLQLPDATPESARQNIVYAADEARQLRHENILAVTDVLDEGGQLGLLYEHVEAEPLRSLTSWANLRCLTFPLGVSLRIVVDLLQGLEALHRSAAGSPDRAVYGGLSPDSVLIARDGCTRLGDPVVSARASLLEGIGFNTTKLAYAAPEQVHVGAPLMAQCDLFTCGVMLWELLTTRRLLAGSRAAIERRLLEHDLPTLSKHSRADHSVSPALAALVEAALSADPAERPASAADMAERLERCQHDVASREEVALFVSRLSGQRFDRRSAAIRSKSTPQLEVPLELPAALPKSQGQRRGTRARPEEGGILPGGHAPRVADAVAPAAPDLQAPESRRLTPLPSRMSRSPTPLPPAVRESLRAAAQLESSSLNGATWETVRAPVAENSIPPRPHLGRTMTGLGGIGQPAHAPSLSFTDLTRAPFTAAHAGVPDPHFAAGSSEVPVSPRSITPTARSTAPAAPSTAPAAPSVAPVAPSIAPAARSDRPMFLSEHPFAAARPSEAELVWRRRSLEPPRSAGAPREGWEQKPAPGRASRRTLVLVSAAALCIAGAVGGTLLLRPDRALPEGAAVEARVEGPLPDPMPPRAAPTSEALPPEPAALVSPEPAPKLGGAFDSPTLDDKQLAQLFALEQHSALSSCKELLHGAAFKKRSAAKSKTELVLARKKLAAGETDAALASLCESTARDPFNVQALVTLSDLALQLGDAKRARRAAERALERKPKDRELVALRGDSLALLGDIAKARELWLSTFPKVMPASERRRKLASMYRRTGERFLELHAHGNARSHYRRALILSNGGAVASIGFSEALLGLGQTRAALAWAERAALLLPKDSRVQVLLGDAYDVNGQTESARAAWQNALDVKPGDAVAARRVNQGRRRD